MFKAVVESRSEKSQLLGGFTNGTVAFPDFGNQEIPFLVKLHLTEPFVIRHFLGAFGGRFGMTLNCLCVNVQVFGLQDACAGKAEGALDDIFQFADVSWPVIFLQLAESAT